MLASHLNGKRLNSPDDVIVRSDGSIRFSDPHYGIVTDYEGHRAEQELRCSVSTGWIRRKDSSVPSSPA